MELHDPGPGHVEHAGRLRAIRDGLAAHPEVRWHTPAPVDPGLLLAVHHPHHVSTILGTRGRAAWLDPDTSTSPGSVYAALLAAGAAVEATRSTVAGNGPALALVRPPGHHATPTRAMGFCLFNNVAVAAAHAIDALGVSRVLVVDWDVHHGNGTQDIFWERGDVLFVSTHQGPDFYPGTGGAQEVGAGPGAGATLNFPLPEGTTDRELIGLFDERILPAARAFAPELVLVSAGFDGHADDPLGGLDLTEVGFATVCRRLADLARDQCAGRIALVLEGGYDLRALARSVRGCVDVLAQA